MEYIKSSSRKDFQDNCDKYKMKMMSESDLKNISNSYSNDARKLRDLLHGWRKKTEHGYEYIL